MTRFGKHPDLLVWAPEPFNAEPPVQLLRQSFVTPLDLFYVRNHGAVPEVDPASYRLSVRGLVVRELELRLEDLKQRFRRITLGATLSCAGNRRSQLIEAAPIAGELPWRDGAIGHGNWTGARLADVLAVAGLEPGAHHAAFVGLDEAEESGQVVNFGGSIPLAKALSAETLLAYELNGGPLPPAHGFPLRVVVPGYIGARSVKWLSTITVGAEPSANYFQRRAYRLLPPHARPETVDPESGFMLGEMPVNSAICRPGAGEAVPAGETLVEGWAIAGGDRAVTRVDLSSDGGRTWLQAELEQPCPPWSWCFWRARLQLEPGRCELAARAWDSAANTQPDDPAKIWNPKGYVNNAWHRVGINIAERLRDRQAQ